MKTVVFGDMHNRDYCVKDLFRKIGLMDDKGERVEGFHTIQAGDLLSLGYGEQEAEFLKWVRPFIDEQLIGNHELPAFTPYSHTVQFVGWEDRDIVAEQMIRSEFMRGEPNLWKAATNVGKWLIVHAGASIQVQKELGLIGKDAEHCAKVLNDVWEDHLSGRIPDPVILNASQSHGGIFWVRLEYLRAGYMENHVPQIVGHTGFDRNRKLSPPYWQNKARNLIGLDTPASVACLITEDEGESWDIVTSDYQLEYNMDRLQNGVQEWQDAIRAITPLDELPPLNKRQGWLPT